MMDANEDTIRYWPELAEGCRDWLGRIVRERPDDAACLLSLLGYVAGACAHSMHATFAEVVVRVPTTDSEHRVIRDLSAIGSWLGFRIEYIQEFDAGGERVIMLLIKRAQPVTPPEQP